MKVITVDDTKYYSIFDIENIITKELKEEKKDSFNEDEKSGVEWAEHAIMLRLQEME